MKKTIWTILIICYLLPLQSNAQSPEEKGLSIALKAEQIEAGFQDSSADMQMMLKNKHGQKSLRSIRIRTLEVDGDGDKSLSIFDNPRDVKGTAFLTFSHKTNDDDQWLYLPALKRVKRISSRNKSGSFMGSEFAYEDISSQELEKYTYKWIMDETYANQDCFVFERYPVDTQNSGYTRQMVWMDKQEYRALKIEYYDRKNSLLKTYTATDYHQYLNRYWRAHKMDMINHQNGKSTQLSWANYQFQKGYSEKEFNKNSLKRAR